MLEKNQFLIFNHVLSELYRCRTYQDLGDAFLPMLRMLIPYRYASIMRRAEAGPSIHLVDPLCVPAAFAEAFKAGDRTVCFTISSQLSGTYHAACIARDMVLEEHPDKQICVIDSRSAAGAMVLLIRRARALIEADPEADFETVCGQLRRYQASLRTCFTLENFDNLIKSGRMRPIVGTLLHSLGIHVIADATPEGTIRVADKARGEGKTYRAITALMRQSKDCTGAEVVISHCENLAGAMKLKQQILDDLPVKSVDILSCRGLTSFYAMEKGLILGY